MAGFYDIKNDAAHVIATSSLSWYSSASGHSYQNNNGIPAPPDPTINRTATSANLYKLKGGTGGDRYGLGIALKVMAGDQISIFGKSIWHSATTTSNTFPLSGVLNTFLGSFAGTTTVMAASKGTATGAVLYGNPAVTAPLTTLFGNEPPPSGQTPKAYVNWIIFDDQFRAVSMGSDPVNSTADVVKSHATTGISVPQNGFIYLYCSNESNQDVYFDNLQVMHTRGPLIQERHYYPQGLTMTGISSAAFGKFQANYGYQGKEMQNGEFADSSGLEEYDFEARYYDAQLARWWSQDPEANKLPGMSPYAAMMNNPTSYTDPDGKCPICIAAAIGAAVGGGINVASHWSQITSGGFQWDKFGEAFAIGAVAGAVGVLTGGEAFLAAGGAAAGAGGFLAGAAAGATSSYYAANIEGIGNAVVFGDVYTPEDLGKQLLFGAVTGGTFNGVSAALNGRNFWTGKLPVPKYDISIIRGIEPGNVSINTELTNDKLVSQAAIRADRSVPSTGNPAVDGTLKHKYAERFIEKFQGIYGKRGLETDVYFNNTKLGLRGFLDVKDEANMLIYDYKFGKAIMSTAQALKYSTAHPGYIINIVNKDGAQYIRIVIPK